MGTYIGIETMQDIQACVYNDTIVVVSNDYSGSSGLTAFMVATYTGSEWTSNSTGWNTSGCPAVVATVQNTAMPFHAYYSDQDNWINAAVSADGVKWDAVGRCYSGDGGSQAALYTSGGLSAASDGHNVFLFFRDPGGGAVYFTYSNNGNEDWTEPQQIGINAVYGMSAAVLGNTLCVVCMDNPPDQSETSNRGIMWATYQLPIDANKSWESGYSNYNTAGDPGVIAFKGQFVLCSVGNDRSQGGSNPPQPAQMPQVYQITSPDGKNWGGGQAVPQYTSGGCCTVGTTQGQCLLFVRNSTGAGIDAELLPNP